MNWMGTVRGRAGSSRARGSAGAGRREGRFAWTDPETGEVLRVEVRGTPAYLADLASAGFRPMAQGRLAMVLAGILTIGAGLASWIARDRACADPCSLQSEDTGARECPMCPGALAGPCDEAGTSVTPT